MTTTPHVTVSGLSYEIEKLSDRSRLLLSDLFRTVQEIKAVMGSYRQSLTLTNTYSSGLKTEVEKANLPQLYENELDALPAIKIDETTYNASDLNDEVKAYLSALVDAGKQKTSLEFRLRQLDAARVAYITAIQQDIEATSPELMDPQPTSDSEADS